MRFAERLGRLGTETAFDVLVKAKKLEAQGRSIIHLEIGEPDFDTPPMIVEAAVRALRGGHTHYCASAGLPELREAIAAEVQTSRGVSVSPDNVLVTPGGKPIMFYLILALVNEGDEVIYPDPGFPIYESMVRFVGGRPVPLPLLESQHFRFCQEDLASRISSKTRMIILNSPHNPTGGLLTRTDLEVVAELAIKNDLVVLSDEIYSRIIYEDRHESIASIPGMLERTVILDGFSKTYAMTGWRLGYGVMPQALLQHMAKLVTNSVSCTAPFLQKAGLEALDGADLAVTNMLSEFRQRRDFLVDHLNRIPGISCLRPPGAFYVFPNIKALGTLSEVYADYLLNEAGVAVLSGTSFGSKGEGYIRLSYANSIKNLQEAVDRIRIATARLAKS